MKKTLLIFFAAFVVIVGALVFYVLQDTTTAVASDRSKTLRVLAYSGFLKSWGPGQDLSKAFETKYGVHIEWIEVNNAGMILENLRGRKLADMPDVVVGLDLLSLPEARQMMGWMPVDTSGISFIGELPRGAVYKDFAPFDWAPMTFIFRRGELKTPAHLDDLLRPDYANSLALQDPNSSSTGLYFLIWVLSVKGEEAGFKYLSALKPSIRIISPSWSSSYSLFQNGQAPMVFSFFTSTIYHYINEKDYRYQPVYFDDPQIYSVEYAGVPQSCVNCELAKKFVRHVLGVDSQKILMQKNYMLPVLGGVKKGTPFDFPKTIKLIDPRHYDDLLQKKDEILKKWTDLHL